MADDNHNVTPAFLFDLTGGGTGIGLMHARGLSQAGTKVYIVSRRFEVIEQSAKLYSVEGKKLLIPPCRMTFLPSRNVSNSPEMSQREGHLDILISNAGIVGPMNEPTLQHQQKTFTQNTAPRFLPKIS